MVRAQMVQRVIDNIIGPSGPLMHRHKIGPGNEALVHAGTVVTTLTIGGVPFIRPVNCFAYSMYKLIC